MNRYIGEEGESYVVHYLKKKGWTIKERNYFVRGGEIDIIAHDPEGYIVYIEVKTYSPSDYTHPLESITPEKQRKWKKAAMYYAYSNKLTDENCRFDAITVDRKTKKINHYHNV